MGPETLQRIHTPTPLDILPTFSFTFLHFFFAFPSLFFLSIDIGTASQTTELLRNTLER
jgi:hypothetical protein